MPFDTKVTEIETKALKLWVEITEVNPLARRYTWGDIPIRQANETMKEAQKLDPTGITVLMLLQAHLDWFLENEQVPLSQFVGDREHYLKKLSQIDEFCRLMEDASVAGAIEAFQKQLIAATKSYKWHNKKVAKVVWNVNDLAFIRRDALLAMDALQEHQFLRGKTNGSIKYNPYVYEFWNVNTLLDLTVRHSESGISVCLVRDHKALFSFFAFVVRNGGNLYVLTDMADEKYPGQQYMTRRPDREFAKRAFKFRFPYQLLDIPLNPMREKQPEGLVLYQKEIVQLKEIGALEADQVLWITMMFDLIKERYWNQRRQVRMLSYTGEMVERPTALLDTARSLVPVRRYRKLTLPVLKTDDLVSGAMAKDWERKPVRSHGWMEDRYAAKAKKRDLNRVCEYEGVPSDRSLTALDPRSFGTKTQLRKDARWVARYNQAVVVQKKAEAEFKRRKKSVKKWYEQKVKANVQVLLAAIGKGKFLVPHWVWDSDLPPFDEDHGHRHEDRINILKIAEYEREERECRWGEMRGVIRNSISIGRQQVVLVGPWDRRKGKWHCFIRQDVIATVHAEFSPGTAEAVAALAGVEFEKLPDVIQHWSEHEKYSGNHLLSNVDPMEWVPSNPWRELSFEVGIVLCKRERNKLQKQNRQ